MNDEQVDGWLKSSTAIAIVGDRGQGKTAMSYALLDRIKDRPVHIFDHPKPWLVEERGWQNMFRLEGCYEIDNAVVLIDEPQLSIPTIDKRANTGLQKLLSIARHRDLTLIFATCDTRWISRALESYISSWIVKDIEPRLVKQGALIRKIIQKFVVMDADEFHLNPWQYLFYNRHLPELDGLHTFKKPEWFNEEWSKPYATSKISMVNPDEMEMRGKPARTATNGKVA